MQLSIIPPDSTVVVDGRALQIDLAPFAPLFDGINAVQWKDTSGHEEFTNSMPNVVITDIDKYLPVVDVWTAEAARIDKAAESEATFDPEFDMGGTIKQILTL